MYIAPNIKYGNSAESQLRFGQLRGAAHRLRDHPKPRVRGVLAPDLEAKRAEGVLVPGAQEVRVEVRHEAADRDEVVKETCLAQALDGAEEAAVDLCSTISVLSGPP